VVIWLLLGVLIMVALPESPRRTWLLVGFSVCAQSLAGALAIVLPSATFHRLADGIVAVLTLAVGLVGPVVLLTADERVALLAHTGFCIYLLGVYGFMNLRFVHAVPVAWAIGAMDVVALFGFSHVSTRMAVHEVFWLLAAQALGMRMSYMDEKQRRRLFYQQQRLAKERAKSESLLRNILPSEIAERLKSEPSHIADGFADVTILFADIVGFTDLSARLSPAEVVEMLNRLFTAFDDLADKHGLEKIKTIGDAYMVVGGLPEARADHAEAVVAMAIGMRAAVDAVARETGYDLKIRIGANSGPVVAGVIGKKKFAYDLWGDAVNTASRMESHGLAGEIQVTESTWAKVNPTFHMESRGTIMVKGKGEVPTWFVRGPKA